MKPPLNVKSADDFQTPPEALSFLLPYIDTNWIIWECAQGKANLSKRLVELNYRVIGTDISTHQSFDFRYYEPENRYDCIITNPPYSLKQQFLERCYELGKPFALLLPLTTFETTKRQQLFNKYGIEVIFLPKRINFETPSGKGSGSWFATAWFTNGLKIGRQLVFPTPTPKGK